jgi:hypothetical protein
MLGLKSATIPSYVYIDNNVWWNIPAKFKSIKLWGSLFQCLCVEYYAKLFSAVIICQQLTIIQHMQLL